MRIQRPWSVRHTWLTGIRSQRKIPSHNPIKMDGSTIKKRRLNGKKIRGHDYHSSSEEESALDTPEGQEPRQNAEQPGHVNNAEESAERSQEEAVDETGDDETEATDASSEADEDSDVDTGSRSEAKKRKRNDPDIFATSISKILGSKLTTSKRADPVLSRSKDASDASKQLTDTRLEARAKSKLREERRLALEKGRVKDVMGLQSTDTSTAEIMEEEKRLRKTAQRGVIKLFNAVRAAQIKGEEAAREARTTGIVGMTNRKERVNEMSKKGFLELIAAGGKKPSGPTEAT